MEVENNFNNNNDYMEVENIVNNNNNYMEVENIVDDESIKAKIDMLLFICQTTGVFTNNNYNSIDDLIEDTTDRIYNILNQQLIFYGDYDTAFNRELRDAVKYHVTDYFTD